MKHRLPYLFGCMCLLVACANEVIVEEPQGSPGGPSGSGSSSSGTGSSSTSSGAPMECVINDQDPQPTQPTCADLDRLILVDPVISDDTDGDGLIEPGESATITVTMKEISGLGFNWYPGVIFTSSDSAVGAKEDTWFYAMLPCGEMPVTGTIKVDANVAPGKTAVVRASVNMINGDCTDTFTLEIPVKVQ